MAANSHKEEKTSEPVFTPDDLEDLLQSSTGLPIDIVKYELIPFMASVPVVCTQDLCSVIHKGQIRYTPYRDTLFDQCCAQCGVKFIDSSNALTCFVYDSQLYCERCYWRTPFSHMCGVYRHIPIRLLYLDGEDLIEYDV